MSIILKYPNVELNFRCIGASGMCLIDLQKEISNGKYGYKLEAGGRVYSIKYDMINYEVYYDVEIVDITESGIVINPKTAYDYTGAEKEYPKEIPFKKLFPSKVKSGHDENGKHLIIPVENCVYIERDLIIYPCETLYEASGIEDLKAGKVPDRDYDANGKWIEHMGRGIWNNFNRRRNLSPYAGNLQNFIPISKKDDLTQTTL